MGLNGRKQQIGKWKQLRDNKFSGLCRVGKQDENSVENLKTSRILIALNSGVVEAAGNMNNVQNFLALRGTGFIQNCWGEKV